MKVLMISSLQEKTPPSGYGGVERIVDWTASALSELGLYIYVIRKEGSKGGRYISYSSTDKTLLLVVKRTIKNIRPDLVHMHVRNRRVLTYLRRHRIPTVITLHNNFRKTSRWVPIIQDAPDYFYFTCVSKSLKRRVVEALKYNHVKKPRHDITILNPGIDTKWYSKKIKRLAKKYFIYLGVVAPYKGVANLAQAFNTMQENFLIVGPYRGIAGKNYIKKILGHAKRSNVQYYGATRTAGEKIRLLCAAKGLLVATGYDKKERDCFEAFGLIMLEANALGVPVIGFDKGNISDYIINGGNGYKFKTLKELPVLIEKVEHHDMTQSCLKHVQQYDVKKNAGRHLAFYKRVISDNNV